MTCAIKKFELLRWYGSRRRRLPWRERPSPYRTWISEIMLQQTQVAAVLPYYNRFLRRFPDVRSLAGATEAEVLRLWAGLGYYSRARNLRLAARKIVRDFGGRFPDNMQDVHNLPGVGRYTAGAILSIAFQKPYPVLDGNAARVFSRLFAIRGDVKSRRVQERLWRLAEESLDRDRPGDWNQALMELGALVCVPGSPRCGECPLSKSCAARKKGIQDRLPESDGQKAPVSLRWTCLWIQKDGKVLLWKRSDAERFLRRHWSFPEPRHLPSAQIGPRVAAVRHSITHHRIALHVRRASAPARLPPRARWMPLARLPRYLVSSLWLKALKAVV